MVNRNMLNREASIAVAVNIATDYVLNEYMVNF